MPLVTYLVIDGNDDVRETNLGVLSYTDSELELKGILHGGIRFQNVTVPRNSTINSATLRLYARPFCLQAGNCTSGIKGRAVDNLAGWSSGNKPSTTPHTVAVTTLFDNIDFAINGPYKIYNLDVKAQIEEITSRSGWAAGNALGFFLQSVSYGRFNRILVYAYEHAYPEPRLIVDYDPPENVARFARSRRPGVQRRLPGPLRRSR